MDHDHPDSLACRLADSLQQVEDLDNVQSVFVSNDCGDTCPPLQRALLELLSAERMRRDGTDIEGYPLPEFATWPCESLLGAGMSIVVNTEMAAMAGDPDVANFGFRLLQFWFIGASKTLAEVMP